MEYRLLEKTELWVKPVRFSQADLGACARAAADALDLEIDEIMVTDALGDTLTFDILVSTIRAEKIVGRKEALLNALGKVSGVSILDNTEVHSNGVLGLISLDENIGRQVLERSSEMAARIGERIQKMSMVCATGQEVLAGQIHDTNTPFLMHGLEGAGYQVTKGPTLDDDANSISRAFRAAAEDGYGLLITTGGIGAEMKDQTLTALERVDPQAKMPYILKFQEGQGRHHRDGVRIGVGVLEPTLIVCLPGPNDEVKLAWPVLKEGIAASWDKDRLAEALAGALRRKFLDRRGHRQNPMEGLHMEEEHDVA